MKFAISYTSEDEKKNIKNFKTLKDLILFMESVGHPLIIQKNFSYGEEPNKYVSKECTEAKYEIEIYDSYRE